jgi:hypothetical protein
MNPLLKYSKEFQKGLPLGSGRYYARLSQSEFVQAPGARENIPNLLFEAFDAQWFDEHPAPESPSELADYYNTALLVVLQAHVLPSHERKFSAMEYAVKMGSEDEEPDDWFVIDAFPSQGRKIGEDELPLTIYTNLYQPGIEATAKDVQPTEPNVAARLRKSVSTAHIPDATESEIDTALGRVAGATIDCAIAYDVGQGNSIGLCNSGGSVEAYFDLGGGVLANAGTFSPALTSFCFTSPPPIVLSHWDFDHWSSVNRDTRALTMKWIAPRQRVGPSHLALMTSIMSSGRLLLVPPGSPAKWRGQLFLELCTGRGRNHSGIALTLSEKPNGVGERMLFPGDARYPCLPSFPPTQPYLSVVAPHHGADMRNRTVPSCPRLPPSRLVYSYGPGNTFSHPRRITRKDHGAAGWHDPSITSATTYEVRETANRTTHPLGHVLLGWKTRGTPPPLPCAGAKTPCQLQAQQL